MAYNLHAIEQMHLRGRRRVDGMGRVRNFISTQARPALLFDEEHGCVGALSSGRDDVRAEESPLRRSADAPRRPPRVPVGHARTARDQGQGLKAVWKSTSVSGAPSSGEEPALPRGRSGVASMA